MKQEMTSADVAAIVAELSGGETTLIDAKIEKIYQPAESEIRLNLYIRDRGRDNLIIESGKRLHMSKYLKESPKLPQGFPMLLRKHIMGGRITYITQHEFDRIIKIGIVRGGEETMLIVELFSKGNVILTDKDGKIILPLKPVTFKDRRIRSGEIYELPEKQLNPLKTNTNEIKETLAASDKDVIRTLANNFNLGGLYSEEIFYRCSIPKSKPAKELTDSEIQQINQIMAEMMAPIQTGTFVPKLILKEKKTEGKAGQQAGGQAGEQASGQVAAGQTAAGQTAAGRQWQAGSGGQEGEQVLESVLESASQTQSTEPSEIENEKPSFVLPENMEIADVIALDLVQYKDLPSVSFSTFSEALDEAFGKTSLTVVETKKEEIKKDKKTGVYERRLNQQAESIEKFKREIEKNTKIAESIYSNYAFIESVLTVLTASRDKGYSWDEIKKIIEAAKKENKNEAAKSILSIHPAEASVTVDLKECKAVIDIRKTIPQNANVYYEQAKKFEKKKEGADKAILETKAILEKQEKDKENRDKERAKAISSGQYVLNRKKHWYDRFKWFVSSDGFLVIGGRDSDTNEEIFKKYTEKRDFVLHTQYPGAPFTVIKTEGKEVPETTFEEAATFAVSHSSLWKSGSSSGDCYLVKAEQVSKTPESGEYVPKGSFIIRGERRYFKDVLMELAVGLELEGETRVIGGPITAVKTNGKYLFEIVQGKFNQNDLSKKIYRQYTEMIKDQKFLKQIASPDLIAMVMPPGESDIRKGPDGQNVSKSEEK